MKEVNACGLLLTTVYRAVCVRTIVAVTALVNRIVCILVIRITDNALPGNR
jgi:hypothetical protein